MASTIEIGDGAGGQGTTTATIEILREGTNYGTTGEASFPIIVNSNSGFVQEFKNLSSGANTITVPVDSYGVYMRPPTGNSTSVTLKGVTGDTGIRLHNTAWSFFAVDSSATSFVITTGGTINGFIFLWV